MSTNIGGKINRLLLTQPYGVVFLSAWLGRQGYSPELLRRYKSSKWLEAVGFGALKRYGEEVGYEGGIYALQQQAGLSIHPGGRTAFSLLGRAHYLEISAKKVTLFGAENENLPAWFTKHDWATKISYHAVKFLPPKAGLVDLDQGSFSIKISGLERAMMECLYLAPEKQELQECYELMESLNNLQPKKVQRLLEECTSVKVKRLFLCLAEKAGHSWLARVKLDNVALGKGKRSLVKDGVFNKKYQITVPKSMEEHV
ncbi:MAG: type IV toxin-antitoxin system AbiEi family antitoxin domain-containing protein [Gammaproteobacteria bacterium]